MFNPKVSIIVPLYNCVKYIEQCIDSIYSQTYKNIEVFCIDNESTDGSYDLLKKIKENKYNSLNIDTAPNIYPFCWEEARDKALEKMSGDYCHIMASDDYLHPNFIQNNIDIFSKAPNNILALQSGIKGVQNNKELQVINHSYNSISDFKQQLLKKCVVNTPTVVYNRKLYDTGLLKTKPELYSGAADYDMYFNLADKNIFVFPVPQWLGYYYRWHEEQATWGMHKSNIKYDIIIQNYWREKWTQDSQKTI